MCLYGHNVAEHRSVKQTWHVPKKISKLPLSEQFRNAFLQSTNAELAQAIYQHNGNIKGGRKKKCVFSKSVFAFLSVSDCVCGVVEEQEERNLSESLNCRERGRERERELARASILLSGQIKWGLAESLLFKICFMKSLEANKRAHDQ